MIELYTLVFGNIQAWFYCLGITYMIGLPIWFIWKRFIMHKKDK